MEGNEMLTLELRLPTIHILKCWPGYFGSITAGIKRFEIRKADREFCGGDLLLLRAYDPVSRRYTGQMTLVKIAGIDFEMPGIADGYLFLDLATVRGAIAGVVKDQAAEVLGDEWCETFYKQEAR